MWSFLVWFLVCPLMPPLALASDDAEVDRLIKQLRSESFKEREAAIRALVAIGEQAVKPLQEATKSSKDAESRRNAERALKAIAERLKAAGEVRRHQGPPLTPVGRAIFSPDRSRVLVYRQADDDRQVCLWDIDTGKVVLNVDMRPGRVGQPSFSPNGRELAIPSFAEDDYTIRIWDVEKGAETCRLAGHKLPVYHAAYSPDGRYIMSSSSDKTLRLWEIRSSREIRRFEGHEAAIFTVEFSPEGGRAISASLDGSIRLWDVRTAQELRQLKPLGMPSRAVFSSDGRKALSSCGNLVGAAANQVRAAGAAIQLWDLETGKETCQIPHDELITAMALSQDGRLALCGTRDRRIRLWDLETKKHRAEYLVDAGIPVGIAFAQDGRRVLSVSNHNVVQVWKLP